MQLDLYQIDAFTDQIFKGNPAAVVPLSQWLPNAIMQAIGMENNLSETACFVPEQAGYRIRWFTPKKKVDLCGHATLASAFVIFNYLNPQAVHRSIQDCLVMLASEQALRALSPDLTLLKQITGRVYWVKQSYRLSKSLPAMERLFVLLKKALLSYLPKRFCHN